MTRKSGVVLALASAPILCGLLLMAGCDSEDAAAPPKDDAERNARTQASTDYMRQQYDSKQHKKK